METPSYIVLSHQMALRQQMDVIANNIANAGTPAYKGEQLRFGEILAEPTQQDGLSFVTIWDQHRDFTEGSLTQTDNPLDLAIKGDAFFAVETSEGVRYTRTGRFTMTGDGDLLDSRGNAVLLDQGAPARLPADAKSISVGDDGTISTETGQVGRLQLVKFPNNQQLVRIGTGLYDARAMPPEPATEARIVQGAIEESNISPVLEITQMISVLRTYQSVSQIVSAENERQLLAIRTITDEA